VGETQVTILEVGDGQPKEQSIPMAMEIKESEKPVESKSVLEEDEMTKEEESQEDKNEDENE
jgi:hypothetical protein